MSVSTTPLPGDTASGRSGPSIWRRVLYPRSPFGLVARLSEEEVNMDMGQGFIGSAQELNVDRGMLPSTLACLFVASSHRRKRRRRRSCEIHTRLSLFLSLSFSLERKRERKIERESERERETGGERERDR